MMTTSVAPTPYVITLQFHLDVERNGARWRIDSPDLPSLHVTAERLVDCRRLACDVLTAAGLADVEVMYLLAGDGRR